jgi:hypothetical protein
MGKQKNKMQKHFDFFILTLTQKGLAGGNSRPGYETDYA